MLKYMMFVAAARAFSLTPQTRRLYRKLGNVVLEHQRMREGLPERYIERANWLVETCKKHGALQSGDQLLEIGTGWLHWEATILRLFFDIDALLFDVVDNRLFHVYRQYTSKLTDCIDRISITAPGQQAKQLALLRIIKDSRSFDEIYRALSFKYVINPQGKLDKFRDGRFDLIVSCDVLEHVERRIVPDVISDMYRIVKPGGYVIHQIDISDHFWYFDTNVSRKNYYRFSEETWQRHFENVVQYINRIQRPEWLRMFGEAGFDLCEEQIFSDPLGKMQIAAQYRNLEPRDLECSVMRVVYRKSSSGRK